MKLFIATSILISLASALGAQNCKCVALKREELTRRGYSADIVVEERKTHKSLSGVARLSNTDQPLENVFVEVFTYPEHWLKRHKDPEADSKRQIRIAGCKTGIDGEFCFTDIPQGKYELRFSLDGGFGITHVIVKVDPKSRKSIGEKIIGIIELVLNRGAAPNNSFNRSANSAAFIRETCCL